MKGGEIERMNIKKNITIASSFSREVCGKGKKKKERKERKKRKEKKRKEKKRKEEEEEKKKPREKKRKKKEKKKKKKKPSYENGNLGRILQGKENVKRKRQNFQLLNSVFFCSHRIDSPDFLFFFFKKRKKEWTKKRKIQKSKKKWKVK